MGVNFWGAQVGEGVAVEVGPAKATPSAIKANGRVSKSFFMRTTV